MGETWLGLSSFLPEGHQIMVCCLMNISFHGTRGPNMDHSGIFVKLLVKIISSHLPLKYVSLCLSPSWDLYIDIPICTVYIHMYIYINVSAICIYIKIYLSTYYVYKKKYIFKLCRYILIYSYVFIYRKSPGSWAMEKHPALIFCSWDFSNIWYLPWKNIFSYGILWYILLYQSVSNHIIWYINLYQIILCYIMIYYVILYYNPGVIINQLGFSSHCLYEWPKEAAKRRFLSMTWHLATPSRKPKRLL